MKKIRSLLLLALCFGFLSWGRAIAHDVKDPVCRMNVDSDTTPYQEKIGGKTFYFCSTDCQSKFDKSPGKYSRFAIALADGHARTFEADLTTSNQPVAGRPTQMKIAIRYAGSHQLVRDFEVVHEKLVHLVLVSNDFSWFEHQHPVLGQDGIFHFAWTFPHPGHYLLFADFTPSDGDNQIKRMDLIVGKPQSAILPKLIPDTKFIKTVGAYRIALTLDPKSFIAGQTEIITYKIADQKGNPISNMQPFLGVMGHLFAISEDGQTAVHTHPLHGVAPGSYQAAMLAVLQAGHPQVVTPDMVSERGPTFTYKLTVPKPGIYKIWAQFMHNNSVLTVPFVVRVGRS